MRRTLAAALLGISLWIGSLAWTGFIMTRTVLDPNRSEAVADALLEDDAVRAQLRANIGRGIAAAVPPGAPVEPAAVEAGAGLALDSPLVRSIIRDHLVRTHQAFLGEGEVPASIDGGTFGPSARDALVAEHPELDAVLPQAPGIEVALPTERVPDAGPLRRALLAAVPVLAAVAAAGTVIALVVTTDRPRAIRRAGFWAIGLSAFVLAVVYGLPAVIDEVAPDQAAVLAALIRALAGEARVPALALAGVGAAAVISSLAWRSAASTVPDEAPVVHERRAPARHPVAARRDVPRGGRRPPASRPPAAPSASPAPAVVQRTGDPTRVEAAPLDATRGEPSPSPAPDRRNARWVDGVGWVHEGPEPIPAGARWVAGVGYVLGD